MKATRPSSPSLVSPNVLNIPVVPDASVPANAIAVVCEPSPRKMPCPPVLPVNPMLKATSPRSFKVIGSEKMPL
jgi:hypothetical protein